MNSFINTLSRYIEALDIKIVVAVIAMVAIFFLILRVVTIAVLSFQHRRDAIKVKLPEIDAEENIKRVAQFEDKEEIHLELISPEEDNIIKDDSDLANEDSFLKSLAIETGQLILDDDDYKASMPEVGDLDEEAIIKAKEDKKRKELESEQMIRNAELRKIAEEDSKDEIEDIEKELIESMKGK